MAGAAAAIAALLLVAPSSEAQVNKKQSGQATKLNAVTKTNLPQAIKKPHRLILQVNTNEPAMMNLALNNASNVVQYYKNLGEKCRSKLSLLALDCICCAKTHRQ